MADLAAENLFNKFCAIWFISHVLSVCFVNGTKHCVHHDQCQYGLLTQCRKKTVSIYSIGQTLADPRVSWIMICLNWNDPESRAHQLKMPLKQVVDTYFCPIIFEMVLQTWKCVWKSQISKACSNNPIGASYYFGKFQLLYIKIKFFLTFMKRIQRLKLKHPLLFDGLNWDIYR